MDDDKQNPQGNPAEPVTPQEPQQLQPEAPQTPPTEEIPKPLYESVPVAEEVAPEVTSAAPSEVAQEPTELPSDNVPPPASSDRSKYLVVIGAAVIFLLIFVVIIKMLLGGGATTSKAITLSYWGLWEDSNVYAPLIQQYKQKNPNINITYTKMDPQDYREKLLARSKNGQGPDIFRFHNTWLPEISDLASPLPSSIMANSDFEKTFYKSTQKDLKVGNYYYGLPLEIDGLVLVYNDNLFKKAGIATAPSTWDDITDDVTKLTVKDKSGTLITAGIAIGTASNVDHFSDILGLMIVQNGGDIKKLDAPEAAGALETYRKFAEPQVGFWNDRMPNSMTAFVQEKVAMIIVPSWEVLTIKNANPDIVIKVVPVPQVPGATQVSIGSYWVEGVSRFSKNQLEAWKFLKYLTEKDSLTRMYEIESRVRPFGEIYPRIDLATLLAQDQYVGAVIKQADNMVSIPTISRTYDNGLNDHIIQYLQDAVNATIQGVSYSEALKTAKLGVDQVFSQFNIK